MQALQDFYRGLEGEELDEAMASYILGIIQNEEPQDGMSAVSDLLSSMSAGFAEVPEDTKLVTLWSLWEQGASCATDNAQPSSCNDDETTASKAPHGSETVASALALTGQVADAVEPVLLPPDQENEPDPELQQLMEFCPAAGAEFLAYVMRTCHGLQGAVEWVLDAGDDVECRERAWRDQLQRAERDAGAPGAAEESKRLRQQVLARFDLQSLQGPGTSGTRRTQAPKPISTWTSTHPASKVRYRDGQVVSSKGEKFVVQTIGEEWDGGSRGKVYTKGKRGKGFQ